MKNNLLLFLLLFFSLKINAQQFNPDSSKVYFVNNISASSSSVNAFPDGSNGYFVIWLDSRTGANNTAIYFQHLNKYGVPQFAQNGKLLVRGSSLKIVGYTALIWQSGIVVAWNQMTTSYADSLFCNYFDFNGTPMWPQRTLVSNKGASMLAVENNGLNIMPTDSGVFINHSISYVGGAEGFTFNRVLPNGTLRWPVNYFQVNSSGYYWVTKSDKHNGFYYAVSTGGLGAHIYVQHFNLQGVKSYASNLDISTLAGGRGNSSWRVVCDEDTNAYVVWESNSGGKMVISKITPNKGLGWTPDYRTISGHAGAHTNPAIIFADNSIYSIWDDGRSPASNYFIYAQRTDTAGNMLWRTDGDSICRLASYIPTPFITKNASGDLLATYLMGSGFLAQRIDSLANQKWKFNGRMISTSVTDKPFYGDYRLVPSPDSSTGIVWTSFTNKICAAKLNQYGNLENANPLPNGATAIIGNDSICAGDTNVIYTVNAINNATKYVWTFSNGVSSASGSDTTLTPSISLNFSFASSNATIRVKGLNNFGPGASSADFNITLLSPPSPPGIIYGLDSAAACINQSGFTYSISPVAEASNYIWSLPSFASVIGNPDSSGITVNYSAYSSSGYVSVSAMNVCGTSDSTVLPIHFKNIPLTEICIATIDSLSQKALIEWQKPIENYVNGYVIFRKISGVYVNIDTVLNSSFSSYLDTTSNPIQQVEKYKIAVLDTCGNIGDISAPFEHQTIRLYGSIQAGGIAKLYWNDYIGINDPQRYFNLLRDTLGTGPFNDTLIKNIPPAAIMNATDASSTTSPLCRYVVEMVYNSNCTPSQRSLSTKTTSRSNIKNKTALFDSSSVGIKNFGIHNFDFKIYPNPVNSKATIEFTLDKNEVINLTINNILGINVATLMSGPQTEGKIKLNLNLNKLNLPPGIYHLSLIIGKDKSIRPLILLK